MYQPLITFCPHPAIFTQVLRIFVVQSSDCMTYFDESVLAFIPFGNLENFYITREATHSSLRIDFSSVGVLCPILVN